MITVSAALRATADLLDDIRVDAEMVSVFAHPNGEASATITTANDRDLATLAHHLGGQIRLIGNQDSEWLTATSQPITPGLTVSGYSPRESKVVRA